ncbi:MAG: ribose 5-phosphate isomerase B [Planctomyces sp.]|nr:ribose 5-phosphate isomerase B [Planctomyces sp.]MBA4039051.1 ribose 5-phosphate isomerase B [Planctomyces sp.]MBA4120283.1 ribose 5-phosphate isomerase B [Isosphaera sp.]
MRIALGADHRGHAAAEQTLKRLRQAGHEVDPLSELSGTPCDYPVPAWRVGRAVADGRADRGLLICGTGIGMCIAANKVRGVRAALAHDELTAEIARTHNDANVLCLSADLLGQRLIDQIVDTFLGAQFLDAHGPHGAGRHARRIEMIRAIEDGREPA